MKAKWVLAIVFTVTLLTGCSITLWRPEVIQERASAQIRDDGAKTTLGQSFRVAHNGLARVDLAIVVDETLPATNLVFRLRLASGDGTLREVSLSPAQLNRNGYTSILFEPVMDSAGKDYILELAAPGAEVGQAFSVYYAADDPYAGGSAYRDGLPLAGDLAFRAYARQSFTADQVWRDFAGRAAQDLGFFASYLVIIAATVGGTLFLIRAR